MEREFKGVWIPKEIWLSKDLSMLEKVLLVEIDSLDNDKHCIASNEYFAEFCNCGTATITRAISHLKELGLIEELPYNGKHRTIRVIKMISQTNQNDESDSSKRLANNINNNIVKDSNSTNVELEQPTVTPKTIHRHLITVDTPKSSSNDTSKKKSRYEQCMEVIDEMIEARYIDLKEVLADYLKMRLAIKDKPMYVSGWKALIRKLFELSQNASEQCKIVRQSLENSWATFYPLKNNYKVQDKNVFSEYGKVKIGSNENEVITNVQF